MHASYHPRVTEAPGAAPQVVRPREQMGRPVRRGMGVVGVQPLRAVGALARKPPPGLGLLRWRQLPQAAALAPVMTQREKD